MAETIDRNTAYAQYQAEQAQSQPIDRDTAYQQYLVSKQENPQPMTGRDKLIQSAKMSNPLGLMSMGFKQLGNMMPSSGGVLPSASDIGQRSQDFLYGGDSGFGTAGNIARTLPVGEAGALLRGAGALAKGAGFGGETLSKMGQYLNPSAAKTLMGGIGKAGLSGGLSTAGLTAGENVAQGRPAQENVLQNAAMGMATGAGLQGALGALGKGANALIGNRLNKIEQESQKPFSQVRTPRQAQEILDAQKTLGIEKLPIDIGALTNQPTYMKYAEVGAKAPFANHKEKIYETIGKVDEAANQTYNDVLKGQEPSTENIIEKVQNIGKGIKKSATESYDKLFKNADKAGINNVETPDLQSISKKHLADFGNDVNQGLPHFLEDSPQIMKLLNKFKGPFGINKVSPEGDKILNPQNSGSLKNLKEMRTKIADVGRRLDKRSPDYGQQMQIINEMKDAINNDIGYNINKSAKPSLIKEWNAVNKNYREKNVPLRDINDIIYGKKIGDDAINQIIKNPKVLGLLDADTRELIGARKLIKSVSDVERSEMGQTKMNVNTAKFVNGYGKLDIAQKRTLDLLFKPETQKKLEALKKIHGATQHLRPQAKPPETGTKLADYLLKGAATLATINSVKHPLAALAPVGMVANRQILKNMTKPEVLQAYANPQLRAQLMQSNKIPQSIPPGIQSLINYYMSQGGQQ